jgi:hypothetical protein
VRPPEIVHSRLTAEVARPVWLVASRLIQSSSSSARE